jgi:hypothetical protein
MSNLTIEEAKAIQEQNDIGRLIFTGSRWGYTATTPSGDVDYL